MTIDWQVIAQYYDRLTSETTVDWCKYNMITIGDYDNHRLTNDSEKNMINRW